MEEDGNRTATLQYEHHKKGREEKQPAENIQDFIDNILQRKIFILLKRSRSNQTSCRKVFRKGQPPNTSLICHLIFWLPVSARMLVQRLGQMNTTDAEERKKTHYRDAGRTSDGAEKQ